MPEVNTDGAPEVWITRENESNLTEEGSEDNRDVSSLSFGIFVIFLITGALWIKKHK